MAKAAKAADKDLLVSIVLTVVKTMTCLITFLLVGRMYVLDCNSQFFLTIALVVVTCSVLVNGSSIIVLFIFVK